MAQPPTTPLHVPALELTDMASERHGGRALSCSDDFFAEVGNLVRHEQAIFEPDRYTDHGKWMDGWESRRSRNGDPTDWAIVELGFRGEPRVINVDTSHFLGNAPREVRIDIIDAPGETPDNADERWVQAVPWTRVLGGARNALIARPPAGARAATHVKLTIAPDGGVARLRVHGIGAPLPEQLSGTIDLAAAALGATVQDASDWFFSPAAQLIAPGECGRMDQGWETRRRREPGDDWIIVRLATPGQLNTIQVDTRHFHGNSPAECDIQALRCGDHPDGSFAAAAPEWTMLAAGVSLEANSLVDVPVADDGVWDHLMLVIRPDGGVARLRAFGTATGDGFARE